DHGARPVFVADALEPAGGAVQRLLPAGLAEGRVRIGRVQHQITGFRRRVLTPDERLRQPVRVGAVVEAVTALDAQAAFVGRPVAAIDLHDALVLDVVRHLAPDTAIRANRYDLLHAIAP